MEIAILPLAEHKLACGNRLRLLIDMLKLSYVEAASLMGVSKNVLRNWMAGENYPQPYALYRLCRSRGVNFDYVFLGDWSSLPHSLGQALDARLQPSTAGLSAPAPKDGERRMRAKQLAKPST